MSAQAKQMKKTIRRVSLLHTLKTIRIITLICLIVDFVQRVYYKYPVKGMYIMILYVFLPSIIGEMLKPCIKERYEKELPFMQKMNGYSKREYYAFVITTVIVVTALVLWGNGTSKVTDILCQFRMGPLVIAIVCVVGSIVGYYYRKNQLVKRLKNNAL